MRCGRPPPHALALVSGAGLAAVRRDQCGRQKPPPLPCVSSHLPAEGSTRVTSSQPPASVSRTSKVPPCSHGTCVS